MKKFTLLALSTLALLATAAFAGEGKECCSGNCCQQDPQATKTAADTQTEEQAAKQKADAKKQADC